MRAPQKALILTLLLLATVLQLPLAIIPHAHAVTYFSEDFEAFPAGWTTNTLGAGTITKDATHVQGGSWAVRIYDPNDVSRAYAYKAMSVATGDYHIQVYTYPTVTITYDTPIIIVQTYDVSPAAASVILSLDDVAGDIYLGSYQLAGGWANIKLLTAGQYYKIDCYVDVSQTEMTVYVDDILEATVHIYKGDVANPDRVYIGSTGNVADGLLWTDSLIIDDNMTTPIQVSIENQGIVPSDSTVDEEQWFFLNASVEVLPDTSTFLFNRIDIDPTGLNMSCSYTNDTGFSEKNDPNNYLQLDVAVSVKTDPNNTFVSVNYYIRIHSNVTKDGAYNVTVYSTSDGLSDTDNYTSVFTLTILSPSVPTKFFGAGFNASSPYVELHWTHDMLIFTFFAVQNSTDKMSWWHIGSPTTTNFTDDTVVNGTENYYRVRACRDTGVGWKYSAWSNINFETVYFVEAEAAGDTYVTGSVGIFLIVLIIIIPIVFYAVKKR